MQRTVINPNLWFPRDSDTEHSCCSMHTLCTVKEQGVVYMEGKLTIPREYSYKLDVLYGLKYVEP